MSSLLFGFKNENKFVHFTNKYSRLSEQNFIEMLKNERGRMYIKDAQNLGQNFYLAKLGADYSIEMRRSVKVAIKEWIKKE